MMHVCIFKLLIVCLKLLIQKLFAILNAEYPIQHVW